MRFLRRKRPWFKLTVRIETPDHGFVEALTPPSNWLRGFEWWSKLKVATPDERLAMLLGALAANEAERMK